MQETIVNRRLTALAAATVLTIIACDSARIPATDSSQAGEYAVNVLIRPITFSREQTRFETIGTSRAVRSVTLFAPSDGEVVEVLFNAGDRVGAGDTLLRMDDREERLAVELAEVTLRDAKQLLARYTGAKDSGAVLPTTLDAARTAAESAQIALSQARVALDKRRVLAPFDGVVGISDVEVGDRIGPDTPIVTLDDRDPLLVRFEVPEVLSNRLGTGDRIVVTTFDGNAQRRDATLVDIGTRIDPASRTFQVRAEVDNEDDRLRPGMSFRITLDIEGGRYARVPEVAVQWGATGAYLWRANDGEAERVPVSIVQRLEGEILVDGPLAESDRIVVEGVQRVREGVRLQDAGAKAAAR
jgi:RND family efflux transporter MFP subunit